MKKLLKRALLIFAFTGLAMVTAVAGIMLWEMPPASVREYWALERDWNQARSQRDVSREARVAQRQQFAERCLQLAAKYPNSAVELAALSLADEHGADTVPGQKAAELLRPRIASATVDHISWAVSGFGMGRALRSKRAAVEVLARVKQELDHKAAPKILTYIGSDLARDCETNEPPAYFAEIAELVVSRFAESPDIYNFCSVLGPGYSCPPWAPQFEKHVNRILEVNQNHWVRCTAHMALAQIAQDSTDRQAEAEERYVAFLKEYDGNVKDQWQNVIQHHRHCAQMQLEAMQFASIGKPAPEILGMDLNGKPMTLSEYRGKVVLMTFWATWCYPCMKLVPHERELADHYAGQPFAIVGVNADEDVAKALKTGTDKKISWRSFRDKREGAEAISDEWKALFPTVYLIDHKGIVRQRYCGGPNPDQMAQSVAELVAVAKGK